MPPKDGPTDNWYLLTPIFLVKANSAATISLMVSDGNLDPHLLPSGAKEDGPVLPWQPPIVFGQTT